MNQCPNCFAPEIETNGPRTNYACGSNDYDQRPGTFINRCARFCMYCLKPGGIGKRELRPYGPGGRDVCAECVFDGPPEREQEAKQQLSMRLLTSEPLLLDSDEQIGPRPISSLGNA